VQYITIGNETIKKDGKSFKEFKFLLPDGSKVSAISGELLGFAQDQYPWADAPGGYKRVFDTYFRNGGVYKQHFGLDTYPCFTLLNCLVGIPNLTGTLTYEIGTASDSKNMSLKVYFNNRAVGWTYKWEELEKFDPENRLPARDLAIKRWVEKLLKAKSYSDIDLSYEVPDEPIEKINFDEPPLQEPVTYEDDEDSDYTF
jgi:hypothetical protein